MPYDSHVPALNAELTSVMFRGQFQCLKSLIGAMPGITDVQIDSVTTLDPGEPRNGRHDRHRLASYPGHSARL